MSVALDHWLIEHREHLLPGWLSALTTAQPYTTNGDGTQPHEESQRLETLLALITDKTTEDALGSIYDGLVHAARGDKHMLDSQIQGLITAQGNQHGKLPDLLCISSLLRQKAWDILQQDVSNPAATFSLMGQLNQLLDETIQLLAYHWETNIEGEIQERISQAEFIAESMASAIEQADRTALQLSSLNLASQRLSANLENTEKLIEQVGSTLLELIGVAHISLWIPTEFLDYEAGEQPILSPDKANVTLRAVRGWGKETATSSSIIDIAGMELDSSHHHDVVWRSYTRASIVFRHQPDPSVVGEWYQKGCGILVLPLLVKEIAIGVVCLQDSDPEERFSRSQQDMARALVNQAAVALENARLYDQIRTFNIQLEKQVEERTKQLQAERDRLGTVHEISTEISSTLDLDTLLQTSLAALARITNVEYGSIMLLEADTGHLVNRATLGHKTINTFTRFPLGSGVAGWVAQHKQPALIENVSSDDRWIPLPLSVSDSASKQHGSMVAVPLSAHSQILGVLILSHSQLGYFNEDHLRLLTASAGAIAIGINNANMYNAIFEGMERSSELLHRQQMETSKMEAILQSLSDGVLVCDTYGEILSANYAAGRILQCDITDLFMGTTLHDVLQDLLGPRVNEMPLKSLLADPLTHDQESRIIEATVEVKMRMISLTMGPVLKDDQELIGALLLMHDITREVEAERMKTEFIGTMSHELRTPMTAIKGFTQLLAMGGLGPVNDTQREFLNTIQNNAERMISMINDVLDITKIETGSIDMELRPIHLAESLSGVVSELQSLKESRQHTLEMSIPTGLPLVHADSSRLHQVLTNLLSNAFKYTPQGGEITIAAREVSLDDLPEHVRRQLSKDQEYVLVEIQDTGVGISDNELDLIFERFYRTENKLKIEAGGTGLGLSLVKPLIEVLGGNIWVESTLDEGSTFTFVLPSV
jgi:signal transduction histidine kinase